MATSVFSCLDTTGVMPHPIGLGTYLMDREKVATAIRSAVQAGYRRIDCAPVYFNEDAVGDALSDILQDGIVTRSDLYVVSKLPSPFHRNVETAVRKTLNDLRLDYLDLYLGTC
jgi:diketogulonate reductase-like aldo/keto reductase